MKQVTQRLRDGRIEVLDVPVPALTPQSVLIDVRASLLSVGTERSKVEAGRQSLLGKARARPDQVAQVIEKARRDGLRATVDAVRARLDAPSPLGYSAAGVVLVVGDRVTGLAPGGRVACGGGGYAVHAEVVAVPSNLVVPLPPETSFEEGAFATVGAIAMHGVRQADVRLGERVAVVGLGLVGRLAAGLLRAAGCTVIGIDLSDDAVERARAAAAIDAGWALADLGGKLPAGAGGCDAVLLCAATSSDDPIRLAPRLCRDRGRVVVVGDVGLDVPRAPYYDGEIDLRLSRSYGPGRYDPDYEEHGVDYPIGYVRWTERRNMAAFVELVADGRLDVGGLISERVPVERAAEAYDRLLAPGSSPLGVVITYEESALEPPVAEAPQASGDPGVVSVIGAGSYAQRVMIPALSAAGFRLHAVASGSGLSAKAASEKHEFAEVVSVDGALADPAPGVVAIATRHDSHADLAIAALEAGKAVFVEKPPGLTRAELDGLRAARAASGGVLWVGFNRRWAPLARTLRERVIREGHPAEILIRVAAGPLPADSWIHDPLIGGGRLLGEGCHFVDLACWLVGRIPARIACVMRASGERPLQSADRFSIALDFADGSVATILYGSAGAASVPKEYIEVHCAGRTGVLDDFRTLTVREGRGKDRVGGRGQDKGHGAQFAALRRRLGCEESGDGPDALDTMEATIAALESARGE